jgi:hypothetical protein
MRGAKDLMEFQRDIQIFEKIVLSKSKIKSDKQIIEDLLKKLKLYENA